MPDNQYVPSCQLPTLPDFHIGEQHPIDNQLFTKTFCSPPGDRLSVRDAGKRKDCGLTRKSHPAHSGYRVMIPRASSS